MFKAMNILSVKSNVVLEKSLSDLNFSPWPWDFFFPLTLSLFFSPKKTAHWREGKTQL